METPRASAIANRVDARDENAQAFMRRMKDPSNASSNASAFGKTFANSTANDGARKALGNITNQSTLARGGKGTTTTTTTNGKESVVKKAHVKTIERDASASIVEEVGKKEEPTLSAFAERVKATLSVEELASIRARAEMYADEADDIEYFGKTRAEQAKEEEARNQAEVEERVRVFLEGASAMARGDYGAPARAPTENDETLRSVVQRLSLSNSGKFNFNIDGTTSASNFDAKRMDDIMDDMCNYMSPTKAPVGMFDDDDFAVRFDKAADLSYLDAELDAMLADENFTSV